MTRTLSPKSLLHVQRWKGRDRVLAVALAIAAAVLPGCQEKKEAPVAPPPDVLVAPVEQKDVPIYSEWVGTTDGNVNAQIRARVRGYLQSQKATIAKLYQHDSLRIPCDLFFGGISGLSHEVVERLDRAQPETFGEARRLPGLTPAALSTLLVFLSLQQKSA